MKKISHCIITIFLSTILLFNFAQNTAFSIIQENQTQANSTTTNSTVTNSTNATLAAATAAHIEAIRQLKFDLGFEKKINDMINSGETREYTTIIIVKKSPENGLTPEEVAKENKAKLVNALVNDLHAEILYVGQKLSFVTAKVPLQEVSKLADYDYVLAIGDGEQKLQPLSLTMDDAKFNIDVPTNLQYNGSGVKVAVIDTGIAQNLTQDLPVGTKIIAQVDCTPSGCITNGNYNDSSDHGTHNAGIIAGLGMASSNMKGVAPGALLLNEKNGSSTDNLGVALDWALINGARIANISWGAGSGACNLSYQVTLSRIADEAVDEGLVVVAAAGNSGPSPSTVESPACSYNAIAIGALDDNDTRTMSDDNVWVDQNNYASARGPVGYQNLLKPDLIAPGVRINATDFCTRGNAYHTPYNLLNYFNATQNKCLSTPPSPPYGNFTGTSHAAPFVSGVAALLLQAQPEYTPVMVKAALLLGANWTGNTANGFSNNATSTGSMYENNWKQYNNTLSARGFGEVDANKTITYANTGRNIIQDAIGQNQVNQYAFTATQGQQVKVILSWLLHPLGNIQYPQNVTLSNLDLVVTGPNGYTITSNSTKQNNEFTVFNAPYTGSYTIKVSAPYVPSTVGMFEIYALASTNQITPIVSGLDAYWPFEEGSGTTTADASGNGNTGTLVNSPTWTSSCQVGNCLTFNGVNNYVKASSSSSLNLTNTGTISAWIKISSNPNVWGPIVAKRVSGSLSGFSYELDMSSSGDNLRGLISNGNNYNSVTGTANLVSGTWYLVTFAWDGTHLKLYLNGNLEASATQNYNAFSNSFPVDIGVGNDTSPTYFKGSIDEVKVYNTALNQTQVQQAYSGGSGILTISSGVGHWTFDEGSGSTAYDTSGYHNNGVINGATWQGSSSCKEGTCLSFNGISNDVNVTSSSSLGITSAGTLTAWINIPSSTHVWSPIIAKRIQGNAQGFSYELDLSSSGDNLRGLISNGISTSPSSYNIVTDTSTIPINTWEFVAFTWNGTGLQLYVNGNPHGSIAQSVDAFQNNFPLTIGVGEDITPPGPVWFSGSIDDIHVYSRALSQSEIQQLYNNPG